MQEPALAVDPTSNQTSEQLPTYNAYSADGDVTGPLVYVNYGNREDYEQLDRISPTIGMRTGYAAALAEAKEAERGLAVLDSLNPDAVSCYQPYWAVRAHLLESLGKGDEAQHAYDRAIGLAEDPAVREFLLQKRA